MCFLINIYQIRNQVILSSQEHDHFKNKIIFRIIGIEYVNGIIIQDCKYTLYFIIYHTIAR